MKIEIHITSQTIEPGDRLAAEFAGVAGAVADFRGIVRDLENGQKISALEYEAYSPMAENELRRILELLGEKYECLAARVIHRVGIIPVGETAIYVGMVAKHRGEAFAALAEFMDLLKQDVPIWKRRALPVPAPISTSHPVDSPRRQKNILSLGEALAEIFSRCQILPAVRTLLAEAAGRTLLEIVCASEDFPASDRSTRDGYAILQNDSSESFQVVDTLHAADWKPRELNAGQAVRVATGASLPCENLRVVMQEDVERAGDKIKIIQREVSAHIRKRGEEMPAGSPVLPAGTRLDAGALALLATVGCTQPLTSRQLRVVHFTTGDELVSPEQKLQPGQIRDSNSILIRSLLGSFTTELFQQHLPEDFELAKSQVEKHRFKIENTDLLLVSGGASVGEKDFTRALLEHFGFGIAFNRVGIRPGAPLIFGVAGSRVAFGLPGNPLAHFVCFHLFVATALARLTGATPPAFLRGTLMTGLDDAMNPRETLWPARSEIKNGKSALTPLRWSSSGDVTCLARANALLRVPAGSANLLAGAAMDFLPTNL